jgi:hypothetical protein
VARSIADQTWHRRRRRPPSESENGLVRRVELRGLEPLTPHCQAVMIAFAEVRWRRYSSLSCAFATFADRGELVRTTANSCNCNQNCNQQRLVRQRRRPAAAPAILTIGSKQVVLRF